MVFSLPSASRQGALLVEPLVKVLPNPYSFFNRVFSCRELHLIRSRGLFLPTPQEVRFQIRFPMQRIVRALTAGIDSDPFPPLLSILHPSLVVLPLWSACFEFQTWMPPPFEGYCFFPFCLRFVMICFPPRPPFSIVVFLFLFSY